MTRAAAILLLSVIGVCIASTTSGPQFRCPKSDGLFVVHHTRETFYLCLNGTASVEKWERIQCWWPFRWLCHSTHHEVTTPSATNTTTVTTGRPTNATTTQPPSTTVTTTSATNTTTTTVKPSNTTTSQPVSTTTVKPSNTTTSQPVSTTTVKPPTNATTTQPASTTVTTTSASNTTTTLKPSNTTTSQSVPTTTVKPSNTTTSRPTTPVRPQTTTAASITCPQPNGVFPYPNDCTRYIICQNGTPVVRYCPNGFEFDPVRKLCDKPEGTSCNSALNGKYFRFPWQKKTTHWSPPTQPPRIFCPRANGYFVFQPDCKRFIECIDWSPYVRSCPSSLTFNPNLALCDKTGKNNPCWSKSYFSDFKAKLEE